MAGDLARAAELAAGKDVFAERVDAALVAWELTEAAARLQEARRALVDPESPPRGPAPVYEFLMARKNWETTLGRVRTHPWNSAAGRTDFRKSDPTFHAVRSLLAATPKEERPFLLGGLVGEANRLGDSTARFIIGLAARASFRDGEIILDAHPLRPATGELTAIGPEPWEIEFEAPWSLPVDPSQDLRIGYRDSGTAAPLRIENAYAAGLSWEFEPVPGRFYEAVVEVAGRISLGNRTSLSFRWWGEKDRPLGMTKALRLPAREGEFAGEFAVFGLPPKGAVRGTVLLAAARQEEGDWLEVSGMTVRSFSTGSPRSP